MTPDLVTGVVVAGGFGAVVAAHAANRARDRASAAATRRAELAVTAAVSRARELAADGQWEPLIGAGWLAPAARAVPDPGNPGQSLRLVTDPHGLAGPAGGFVLVAVNGHPDPDGTRAVHALPVPPALRDPVVAAAWTYDDEAHPVRCTPALYARLTRRT